MWKGGLGKKQNQKNKNNEPLRHVNKVVINEGHLNTVAVQLMTRLRNTALCE